jgi:hypothetical protein
LRDLGFVQDNMKIGFVLHITGISVGRQSVKRLPWFLPGRYSVDVMLPEMLRLVENGRSVALALLVQFPMAVDAIGTLRLVKALAEPVPHTA